MEFNYMAQHWIYKYVCFRTARGSGQKLLVYSVDGEFDKGWEDSTSRSMTDYSNRLGSEGWELAFFEPSMIDGMATSGPQLIAVIAVFKRSE